MLSEKIELLGTGVYKDIPSTLTVKSINTNTEIDKAGAEDFDKVMLDKILPAAVEEKINFRNLLEIDYEWLLRCLRFVNYGPYYTVNRVLCDECRTVSSTEQEVDLRTVNVNTLPEGFDNHIVISKDDFIEFDGDIEIHLLTIQERINSENDKMFQAEGRKDSELARICYMITKMKGKNVDPLSAKLTIEKMIDADYKILKAKIAESTNYGLTISGKCTCPNCKSNNANFVVFTDAKFFRPTLADLKAWKKSRSTSKD